MDLLADAVSGGPLLERASVLEMIDGLADDAHAGTGRIGYIEAGPGLGKTALINASADRLRERGMRVLLARGTDLERDFPYGIARQLLTAVMRSTELSDVIFTGAAAPVRQLFGDNAPSDFRASIQTSPFEISHALYWALANLCDLGPMAVLIDDCHEADGLSRDLLAFLAHRLVDLPLLIVLAARPERFADHGASTLHIADLLGAGPGIAATLEPLSYDGTAAVVRSGFASTPDPDFVAACVRATGGNPFYLRELINAVRERHLAPSAENATWVADLGPATIVRRTLFRLASLPPAAVPMARAVAVLGGAVSLRDCAALAEVSIDVAAGAADALISEGLLHAGTQLSFVHPILQAAVLSDLGEHSRRRWHARAAELLDQAGRSPEVVARHLMRADPCGDPYLRDVLVQAARAAARDGGTAHAAALLRRALAETADPPNADLQYELGLAEAAIGQPDGLRLMAAGTRATENPAERAARALRLAAFQMRSGELVEAVDLLTEVRPGVLDDDEQLLAVDTARYWAGRLHPVTRESATHLRTELELAVDGPDSPGRRTLLTLLGCEAAQTESADSADEYLRRALAPPGVLSFIPFDAVAVQAAMLTLNALERHADFEDLADAVMREAGRRGALLSFFVVSTFRTMALLRRGDLAGAEAEAGLTLRSAAEQGWTGGSAALAALRTIALLEQGDLVAAEGALAEAEQMHVAPGFPAALLHSASGKLKAARGDLRGGVAALAECGRTLQDMCVDSPGVIAWRSETAMLLALDGNLERAGELAAKELELARRLAGPIAIGRALFAAATAARGAERIDVLREARATLDRSTARLTQATVAVELGATLRRARQSGEARLLLEEGLHAADLCQCAPLATRARDELSVLGVKPRGSVGFGPLALTPSEVRVARLAAQGRSNTEIAQQLFITRKTVEKHLASCYRKLGIDSRTQLDGVDLTGGRSRR